MNQVELDRYKKEIKEIWEFLAKAKPVMKKYRPTEAAASLHPYMQKQMAKEYQDLHYSSYTGNRAVKEAKNDLRFLNRAIRIAEPKETKKVFRPVIN